MAARGGRYTMERPDGTVEEVQLSGKASTPPVSGGDPSASWVKQTHPLRPVWVEDETRCRASFVATRKALNPYLVPHRFEGNTAPTKLTRAKYGFGLRLNAAYLDEIIGHVRSAGARYNWGPMSSAKGEITTPPPDGVALEVWEDATRSGVPWRDFFEREVLEWLTSSPGGVVVVDAPPAPKDSEGRPIEIRTQADRERYAIRPYVAFFPYSAVEDAGRDAYGFRWLQLTEVVDRRDAKGEGRRGKAETRHVLVERTPRGAVLGRYDDEGLPVEEETVYDGFLDPSGAPMLPVIEAKYGAHPDVPWVGTGLLMALADIVIDLYNILSETREGYRDAAFGMMAYVGPDAEGVRQALSEGSRFAALGADPGSSLNRISGDPTEVTAGLSLLNLGIQAWTLSARRNAAKAMAGAEAQSGVSLQAEFSLDLKPLLVELCEALDAIETNAMYVAGLMAGYEPDALKDVGVTRNTEFRLEDEDTRIARKVEEFTKSLSLPPTLQAKLTTLWAEATGLVDFDEVIEHEVDDPDAPPPERDELGAIVPGTEPKKKVEKMTLGEIIEREAMEIADSGNMARQKAAEFNPFEV